VRGSGAARRAPAGPFLGGGHLGRRSRFPTYLLVVPGREFFHGGVGATGPGESAEAIDLDRGGVVDQVNDALPGGEAMEPEAVAAGLGPGDDG
jgi:hypothetical protein